MEQPPDVVNLRRLDAYHPKSRLQGELDDLLRLAHNIGVRLLGEQDVERFEPLARLDDVARGQAFVCHTSNTSLGR
jgi:hypothetical protein